MAKKFLALKSVIYQSKSGAIELRGNFTRESIWATQAQITQLFNVDQSVVSRHIKNVFSESNEKQLIFMLKSIITARKIWQEEESRMDGPKPPICE